MSRNMRYKGDREIEMINDIEQERYKRNRWNIAVVYLVL